MDFSTQGATPDVIKEGTDQTFMQDVVEASKDAVVLVDFWAPWCGPCKQLTPTIERVVNGAGGKVKLVKINMDENQGVATQLGVRSIPAVFGFVDGRPVDAFMGAQPEAQVQQFVDRLLSNTSGAQQLEEAAEQAAQMFQNGDVGGAAQLYSQILQADQSHIPAIAGLARCYLANEDYDRARQVLEMVPEDERSHPDVKGVQTALDLMSTPTKSEELAELRGKADAEPDNFQLRYELAEAEIAANRHEQASDTIFMILEKDLAWGDGKAKELLLKLFEAAGPKADVTKKGRRRLSALVFS